MTGGLAENIMGTTAEAKLVSQIAENVFYVIRLQNLCCRYIITNNRNIVLCTAILIRMKFPIVSNKVV